MPPITKGLGDVIKTQEPASLVPGRAVLVPHAQAQRQGSGTQQEGRGGARAGQQSPGFTIPPQCSCILPPADPGLLQAQVCRKPRGNATSEPGFPAQISQLQQINPTPDSLDILFYTISTKDGFGPGPRAAFWSLALLCVRLLLAGCFLQSPLFGSPRAHSQAKLVLAR